MSTSHNICWLKHVNHEGQTDSRKYICTWRQTVCWRPRRGCLPFAKPQSKTFAFMWQSPPKPLELWLLIVVSKGGSWVTFFRSHRVRKMRRPVKDGLVSKLSDLSFPVSSQQPTLFCSRNHDHHSLTVTKWLLLKLWQQRSNDQQSGYFNSNHDLYLIPTTLFLCRDLTKPQL